MNVEGRRVSFLSSLFVIFATLRPFVPQPHSRLKAFRLGFGVVSENDKGGDTFGLSPKLSADGLV
jgi:hypothetical protein